jgi:benzoyl-CoA reductase/2-hydroxyglutaryl-CoA dehydratase subunit BcrC/BadD/HgdB
MKTGLQNLLDNPRASALPTFAFGLLPFPMVSVYSEKGERRRIAIGFPWCQETPKFASLPLEVQSFLMENDRILEGVIYERCVACYPSCSDSFIAKAYSVFPCDSFEDCWKRRLGGVDQFCDNTGWREAVSTLLNALKKLQADKKAISEKPL